METIYLTDNGLQLKRKSNRIVVKKDGRITEEIPILDLKRILVFGNNQISTDLMRYLAGKGIEVAFLSSRGRFKFRIVPETSKNIYLRMAQHDRYRDKNYRLTLSRAVVRAKLGNQRSLLVRYQRKRAGLDLQTSFAALKDARQKTDNAENIEALMGLEGIGSKAYFQAYGQLIAGDFEFTHRAYYPPPDPVNALLSFGYMLLFHELSSLLEASGFDIFLGFLHSTRYGRASLATDMMEDLRSPVIDRLVLYLINKDMIKPEQFTEIKSKNTVNMDEEARKGYIANYEKFMTANFQDTATGKRLNFRQVLKDKINSLEKALMDGTEYRPYVYY